MLLPGLGWLCAAGHICSGSPRGLLRFPSPDIQTLAEKLYANPNRDRLHLLFKEERLLQIGYK